VEHTLPKAAKPGVATKARATSLASDLKKLPALKGFDPMALITLLISLIPALAKCFNPTPAPTPASTAGAQAKKYVAAQYDPTTGKYEGHLMNRVLFQTLLTGANQHIATTKDQRRVIAAKVLDDLRTQDDSVVGTVMAEAYAS
jgi:hypothetical protein